MATATEVLMSEHRGIEKMLTALERSLGKLASGDASVISEYAQGIDFLRNFADHCHHYKEEKLLFPALQAKGVPVAGGPIGVMLQEHEQGRQLIRSMAEDLPKVQNGDRAARRDLADAADAYIRLLRGHIQKEDTVLFQMADRLLSEGEQDALVTGFDKVEAEVMGPGVHERYHKMLDSLG